MARGGQQHGCEVPARIRQRGEVIAEGHDAAAEGDGRGEEADFGFFERCIGVASDETIGIVGPPAAVHPATLQGHPHGVTHGGIGAV